MATEIFQLKTNVVQAGQFAECVFNFRIIDPTETNDFLLADQLLVALAAGAPGTSWLHRFAQMMSEEAFISSVRAKKISPSGGNTSIRYFQVDDAPGEISAPLHAVQDASTIIWMSDTEPEKLGRNFIPGVPTDALSGARWRGDQYTRVDAFIAKHLAGFSVAAGIFDPVIWRKVGAVARLMAHGYLSPRVGSIEARELPI